MSRVTVRPMVAIVVLGTFLLAPALPSSAAARPYAGPAGLVQPAQIAAGRAVPAAPSAPLDTPMPIVNEFANEWVIYKGEIYWAHRCFIIPLHEQAHGPATSTTLKSPADSSTLMTTGGSHAPEAPADISTLKRMPIGGGAIATIATAPTNCSTFQSLAADDSGLYFIDGFEKKIKVVRNNGPTPEVSDVANASQATRLRLDEGFAYFATSGQNIYRVPKSGGAPQVLVATDFLVGDFILDGQSIYWFDRSGLWWAPKTCAALPCAKQLLAGGVMGRHMAFGAIAGGGGVPNSIAYVNVANSGQTTNQSINELTCDGTGNPCRIQTYYAAATDWQIGEFKFVRLPRSGRLPVLDSYLFWTETDPHSNTGRLLKRLSGSTTATPSELFPGDAGLNAIMATDAQGVYFSDGTRIMFLPFGASAITRDLAMGSLEVTQSIQNAQNEMALVADKATFVRAYGQEISGPQAGGVEAVLYGTRNGQPLAGSPLQPVNGTTSLSTGYIADRAKADDSWTFRLPASWIAQGNTLLRAVVDPRHRYADSAPANNEASFTASFSYEPNACLFFSPVRTNNPVPHVGEPKFWDTMDRFARVWPVPGVDVFEIGDPIEELEACSYHGIPYPCFGPYELDQASDFPSNFPADIDRVIGKLMLRQIMARTVTLPPLGLCDPGAPVHSVGLVHPDADTTDSVGTLLGYASLYFNASFYKMEPFDSPLTAPNWFWPRAASVMAQEITHNYNRGHIQCGTTDGVDNGFPYLDPCKLNDGGQANYYGFDVKSRLPIAPEIASDFMTYKPKAAAAPLWQGQWVSDYTYRALKSDFGFQLAAQSKGAMPRPERSSGGADAEVARNAEVARKAEAPAWPDAGEMVYVMGAIEPISNHGHLDYAYAESLAGMSAQARSVWQEIAAPRRDGAETPNGGVWGGLSGSTRVAKGASSGTDSALIPPDGASTPPDAASPRPDGPSRLPAGDPSDAPGAVTYHLQLMDAAGTILDDRTVTPLATDQHDGETPAWPFLASFAAPAGTVTHLELLADNLLLDSLDVGAATPVIAVTAPKTGDVVGDSLVITWQASDPNPRDVLHFNVAYSADNGASWLPLVQDYPGTPGTGADTLTLQNPLALPGTTARTALVRVSASDGYHTARATSGAFSVAQRKPVAHLTSPEAEQSYPPNAEVALSGGAIDAESGRLTGAALAWAVDGVAAGSGEESGVRGLKPGTHAVVLTATDPTSRSAAAESELHINPLVVDEAASAPTLDGFCDEAVYADSGSQIQLAPYADGSQATAQLVRTADRLWLCFSGLARGSDAEVGRAGLDADVNLSQDAQLQADDLGFYVGEDGGPFAVAGNGKPGDASALEARVTAAGSVWTAELRIDLAKLGGTGRVIGARLNHGHVGGASDAYAWPYAAKGDRPNGWGQTVLGAWPTLESIEPAEATAGGGDRVLTLTGSNFAAGTVALWDGTALNTTVVSATELSAVVPAARLATAGDVKVQVSGGALGKAPSPAAGLTFRVLNPVPTISLLSPNTAVEGKSNVVLNVTGTGFGPGTTLLWDGQARPTTVLGKTSLRTTLGAAQLQAGHTVKVTVQNGRPGGGPSNALPFVITPSPARHLVWLPWAQRK